LARLGNALDANQRAKFRASIQSGGKRSLTVSGPGDKVGPRAVVATIGWLIWTRPGAVKRHPDRQVVPARSQSPMDGRWEGVVGSRKANMHHDNPATTLKSSSLDKAILQVKSER
jgi:hypothetical protein